jgi:hypothetical protein
MNVSVPLGHGTVTDSRRPVCKTSLGPLNALNLHPGKPPPLDPSLCAVLGLRPALFTDHSSTARSVEISVLAKPIFMNSVILTVFF